MSNDQEKTTISLIGTAIRKDDAELVKSKSRGSTANIPQKFFYGMAGSFSSAITNLVDTGASSKNIELVSGGAAGADHTAVAIYLYKKALWKKNHDIDLSLKLYMPGKVIHKQNGIDIEGNDANVWSYYHKQFQDMTGINSRAQIGEAHKLGAELINGEGNFQRNADVARSQFIIASTFGPDDKVTISSPGDKGFSNYSAAGLKKSGTSHTWSKARNAEMKIHIPAGAILEKESQLARQDISQQKKSEAKSDAKGAQR